MDACREAIGPRLDPSLTPRLVRCVLSMSASLKGTFFESLPDRAEALDKHRPLVA